MICSDNESAHTSEPISDWSLRGVAVVCGGGGGGGGGWGRMNLTASGKYGGLCRNVSSVSNLDVGEIGFERSVVVQQTSKVQLIYSS
jgi:hypothetical protein